MIVDTQFDNVTFAQIRRLKPRQDFRSFPAEAKGDRKPALLTCEGRFCSIWCSSLLRAFGVNCRKGESDIVKAVVESKVILNKAGCLKGVFRTSEPLCQAVDGTPCYTLLRFYEDGLVLHASLCKDVEAKWDEIEQWFNRDAAATEEKGWNTGVGSYTILGSQIQFSTVMYDRETRLRVAHFTQFKQVN